MHAANRPTGPEILAALRTFVAGWFRDGREDGLEPATPLVTSGIVDSAGVFEVVDFVERRFAVRLADSDISLKHCNTLEAWTELVAQKLAATTRR
jgi:acyl carrier protein